MSAAAGDRAVAAAGTAARRRRLPIGGHEAALLAALALVLAAVSIVSHGAFWDVVNIRSLLVSTAITAVHATGMTVVILTGGIDVSIGSMLGLVSAARGTAFAAGWPLAAVAPLFLAGGGLLGVFASGDVTILSLPNLSSMAVFAVEVGIVAVGQTFVICGGDGAIDLSVGAISGVAETVAGLLIAHGTAWPLACAAGLLAGVAMGAVNGLAVAWAGIPAIIVTLATMFAFGGLALVLSGGTNIDLTSAPHAFLALGQGSLFGLPFQLVAIYLPILAAASVLQHRSLFGRMLYLTGTNALAARMSGIPVGRVRVATYVVAGTLSAVAGLVGASRLGTATPDGLDQANLISIAIVVLGGASIFGGDGSVLGTAVATLLIAIADYGLSYNEFNPIYQAGVMGLILVGVVLIENLLRGGRAWRRARATDADALPAAAPSGPPPPV